MNHEDKNVSIELYDDKIGKIQLIHHVPPLASPGVPMSIGLIALPAAWMPMVDHVMGMFLACRKLKPPFGGSAVRDGPLGQPRVLGWVATVGLDEPTVNHCPVCGATIFSDQGEQCAEHTPTAAELARKQRVVDAIGVFLAKPAKPTTYRRWRRPGFR